MDEAMQGRMREIGEAINQALSNSPRINEAIEEVKKAGYDVFLVLEATICFNKREPADEAGQDSAEPAGTSTYAWNSQDEKFLRALKIRTDEE